EEQLLQRGGGVGVDQVVVPGPVVVLPGGGVGVLLPLVDLAGRDPVAEHLHHVVHRHLHAAHPVVPRGGVVDPVLQVVLVPALVVEPGGGPACLQPLDLIGAPVPLVVPGSDAELRGAVLAQVVEQPLAVQPHPEAIFHHPQLVGGDGPQMPAPVSHGGPPQTTCWPLMVSWKVTPSRSAALRQRSIRLRKISKKSMTELKWVSTVSSSRATFSSGRIRSSLRSTE